jgi:hypothetical protein
VRLVTSCYEEKLRRMQLVQDRTWDRWAEAHHNLFGQLLQARGLALPRPAPAFRFGMLGELEIPLAAEVDDLEAAVDQAAAHLYFGEYRFARCVLQAATQRYPCIEKLLKAIPDSDGLEDRPDSSVSRPHIKALR